MMRHPLVGWLLAAILVVSLFTSLFTVKARAQTPRAATAPKPPAGFELTDQEQAYMDQVLQLWEKSSDQVQTFSCPFVRYTYDAFSPAAHIASSVQEGEVSYQKPDKGSFKITKVHRWQSDPVPPGFQGPPKGKHVLDENAIGEHWVCDGKSVFEYKYDQKQLVERPIPPHLQGKSIVDGPLPFLFGAEADKLKARFFMKPYPAKKSDGTPNTDVIQIVAVPKTIVDAVEYQMVEIQLDRRTLLPLNMNVIAPDRSRNAYVFYKDKVQVNNILDRIGWARMFASPSKPLGWKKVVDAPPQAQSAGVPQEPKR